MRGPVGFPWQGRKSRLKTCQTEIWTGRVQDDGFRELGMEEKPVSIGSRPARIQAPVPDRCLTQVTKLAEPRWSAEAARSEKISRMPGVALAYGAIDVGFAATFSRS